MTIRTVDKATGTLRTQHGQGEKQREAKTVRRCREVEKAINAGHDNRQIRDFLAHREKDL